MTVTKLLQLAVLRATISHNLIPLVSSYIRNLPWSNGIGIKYALRHQGFSIPYQHEHFCPSRGFSSELHLKYAKSHEWARVDGKLATIGLSDHAQKHLGGIIHVELPDAGENVAQGSRCGTVESVQASKGLHSSLSGNVVEVNEKIRTTAALVNASPYEDGWIMKVEMSNKEELNNLMDYDEYVSYVENKYPNIDEPVANT